MAASSITLSMPNSGHNQKLFSSLRSIGRRLSRFKILEPLRPLARSFLYTAEPAGRVLIDSTPAVKQDEKCRAITIVSANLWHDFPHYRRMKARLEDFISMVIAENADILLLQEVARTPLLHADTQLSKRLNMAYLYSRVNGHRRAIGFEEGLAVFSRYPLVEPSLRQLSKDGNPFTRRLALGAVLDTPCGHIYAFSTHLSIFPRQNAHQAAQLRDWVQAVSGEKTAIIAGDFNADENQPHIIQKQKEWVDTFRQVNPGEDGTTHELRGPFGITLRRRRLDYVFIKPGDRRWKVLETRHLHIPHAPHSDHHAVLTRLAPISA